MKTKTVPAYLVSPQDKIVLEPKGREQTIVQVEHVSLPTQRWDWVWINYTLPDGDNCRAPYLMYMPVKIVTRGIEHPIDD